MTTATAKPALNSTQLFILQTFDTVDSEEERDDLISLYLDYIQKKLDKAADAFWDNQQLDNAQMEELMYGHLRASKQ